MGKNTKYLIGVPILAGLALGGTLVWYSNGQNTTSTVLRTQRV